MRFCKAKFKTENLYLVKISKIVKIEKMLKNRRYYGADVRYTLAYKNYPIECERTMTFIDIFTHTIYPILVNTDVTGISAVVEAEPVITNTKYLTEEEALQIFNELNPNYLKENTKRLRLFK